MKYRKKPVEVEAIQFNEMNGMDIANFMERITREAWFPEENNPGGRHVIEIETLEGKMYADIGDWIIKGVKGEFYPCKPDIFELTYEKVDE